MVNSNPELSVDTTDLSDEDIKVFICDIIFNGEAGPMKSVIYNIIFRELADKIDWQHVWNDVVYHMPQFKSKEYYKNYYDENNLQYIKMMKRIYNI